MEQSSVAQDQNILAILNGRTKKISSASMDRKQLAKPDLPVNKVFPKPSFSSPYSLISPLPLPSPVTSVTPATLTASAGLLDSFLQSPPPPHRVSPPHHQPYLSLHNIRRGGVLDLSCNFALSVLCWLEWIPIEISPWWLCRFCP